MRYECTGDEEGGRQQNCARAVGGISGVCSVFCLSVYLSLYSMSYPCTHIYSTGVTRTAGGEASCIISHLKFWNRREEKFGLGAGSMG